MSKVLTILAIANSIINSAITLVSINDKSGKMTKVTNALIYISAILDAVIHSNPIPSAPLELTHPALAMAAVSAEPISKETAGSFGFAVPDIEEHGANTFKTSNKPSYQALSDDEISAASFALPVSIDPVEVPDTAPLDVNAYVK